MGKLIYHRSHSERISGGIQLRKGGHHISRDRLDFDNQFLHHVQECGDGLCIFGGGWNKRDQSVFMDIDVSNVLKTRVVSIARQQHLLLRRKEDVKKHLRIKSSFKHHFLFADSPIFGLIEERKGGFPQHVHIKWGIVFPCP